MRALILGVAVSLVLAGYSEAYAVPYSRAAIPASLAGCKLQNKVDTHTSGRFIWKPEAAHFHGRAAVITPRYYAPVPPIVELITYAKPRILIERASMKSTGQCSDNPECFGTASFLTRWGGASYKRGYGSIIVRARARPEDPTKECRYYIIKNPAKRTELQG
jgi:hypothetical protein